MDKQVTELSPMNKTRAGSGLQCCKLMYDGRIVIGGVTNMLNGVYMPLPKASSIEFYDTHKDKWIDYPHETMEVHNGTSVCCKDSIVMMGGWARSNDFENIGHIEWVDIRENGKWKFWDEKTLAVLLNYIPAKDYLAL